MTRLLAAGGLLASARLSTWLHIPMIRVNMIRCRQLAGSAVGAGGDARTRYQPDPVQSDGTAAVTAKSPIPRDRALFSYAAGTNISHMSAVLPDADNGMAVRYGTASASRAFP